MNLPNRITVTRIAAIPLLVLATEFNYFLPGWGLPSLFFIIGISDLADGMLARRLNAITELGKLLDPISDKILVLSGLLILMEFDLPKDLEVYRIPGWSVLLIMAREFAVGGLRSLAASQGFVLAASNAGKIKTTLTLFALGGMFFRGPEPYTGLPFFEMGYGLYWVALVVTILSGIEYFWKNRSFFLDAESNTPRAS